MKKVLALVAGASLGLFTLAAVAAPAAAVVTPASAGRSTISIQRGFGLPCYNSIPLTVFVDGKPVGAIGAGQAVTLQARAGTYQVGIAPGLATQARQTVVVDVGAHQRVSLRSGISAAGGSLRRLH